MDISEHIKQIVLGFRKVKTPDRKPGSRRYTYINNMDNLRMQEIRENMIWYIGDSNELLNFYTNQQIYGNYENPIYNRNRQNYFWGLSSTECDIKRVHSGVPKAIIDTMVSVTGIPDITSEDKEINERIDKIIENNDLYRIFSQKQLPLTLVEGYGAYKINIDKDIADFPIIQYYKAEDVEFVYKSNILIGIVFKDYYKYDGKDYVMLETRRKTRNSSIVEHELFEVKSGGDLEKVAISTVPDCADLEDIEIKDFSEVLGVPSKILYNSQEENYGLSLFKGKIDLFDDLDQNRSQNSQTVRVSTPVEYIPSDMLDHSSGGRGGMYSIYNRQFVKRPSVVDGEGNGNEKIDTSQPRLEFDKYNENELAIIKIILMGIVSPSTLGLDIAKKDNADAQTQKEKITIMTRNKIVNRSTRELKKLIQLCLCMEDLFLSGNKDKCKMSNYSNIEVNFSEFADPSFESKIQTLGPCWRDGEVSTPKYVKTLWGDKLSQEDRITEVEWLDKNRKEKQELAVQAKNAGMMGGKEPNEDNSENTDKKTENLGNTVASENKKSENTQGIPKANSKK